MKANIFDIINILIAMTWGIYCGFQKKEWYIWNWKFWLPVTIASLLITAIESYLK